MSGNILIVDDNPDNLRVLEQILTANGYKVRAAVNGEIALKAVAACLPDLILLDIMMPGMDGFEVCRRLKGNPSTVGVPVLFLSALSVTGDKLRAFDAGGIDYITKPFADKEVLARVRTHLMLAAAHRHLLRANRELSREIETRKKAEEKLRASEEMYSTIFAHIGIGVSLISPKMEILFLNPVMKKWFPHIEVSKHPICYKSYNVPPLNDVCPYCPTVNTLRDGMVHIAVIDTQTEEGIRNFRLISAPVFSKEGTVSAAIEVAEDVTDLKRIEEERLEMERRLLHSQKLESLGVLTGGIAHDFNNLLTIILGNLDLTLLKLPPDFPVRSNIKKALDASQRAAKLIRQMLDYVGKGHFVLTEIDLNDVVYENAALFRASVARNIELSISATPGLPRVKADQGQLQQVIMNLVINAFEAIGANPGVITISTGIQDCDDACLSRSRVEEKPHPGSFVYLEVSDTGCGMDEETQQRFFEPFFTTKFLGRGLGMSAVLGIVRAHNGAIMVKSEKGAGSLFRVLFPVCGEERAHSRGTGERSDPPDMPVLPAGLILVVDDETEVRDMCLSMVHHLGFQGIGAMDGIETLKIFAEHGDEIKLVILDMTMPNMDGEHAFRELKRIRPDVRVILSSGYTVEEVSDHFTGDRPAGFIQKPFKVEDLQRKISEAFNLKGNPSSLPVGLEEGDEMKLSGGNDE